MSSIPSTVKGKHLRMIKFSPVFHSSGETAFGNFVSVHYADYLYKMMPLVFPVPTTTVFLTQLSDSANQLSDSANYLSKA